MIGELVRHFFQRNINGKKIQFTFYGDRLDRIQQFKMPGVALECIGVPCFRKIGVFKVGSRHTRHIQKFHNAQSHASGGDQPILFREIEISLA